MLIQYQNTIDDFRETANAIAAARKPVNSPVQIIILVLVFGAYYIVTRLLWQAAGDADGHLAWVNMWIAIVAFGVTWLGISFPASFRSRRFPWLTGRQWISLGSFVFLIASLIFQNWMNQKYNPKAQADAFHWQTLLPHSIWLVLLMYVGAVGLHNQSTQMTRHWQKRIDLQREQNVEITAEGVAFSDPVCRQDYQWRAFVKSEETRNLFLLFRYETGGLMIPKRAFTGDQELNAMRNLMKLIPREQTQGFEVKFVGADDSQRVLPATAA